MSDTTPTPRERWLRLEPWLERLLDQAPDARAVWLERECDDPELRRELVALFEHGTDPTQTLDQLRSSLLAAAVERIGQSIGPFRILRRLGDGGMGVVYLAERTGVDYEQHVALKLMRVGLYDVAERDRFRRERQILARLSHQHIARLIEGGLTADGVPYLAMEFVDGVPITVWCDRERLSIKRRLHLFLDVCAAVEYAHRNLIVHRDLKPSNIFVAQSGELKLLDFGIAKLLDDSERVDATQTDYRRATPDYAAPEQLAGAPVTTASDVYALGVLLHQLLAGVKPLRREDQTLRLPSLTFAAAAEQAPALANERRTTARGLRKQLSGDLDTLLTTALQPEPEQRYASAAALGDDIRRYLDGRALAARRESVWYRTRKFVYRHRFGTAATIVFILGLVVATAISVQQARRARTETARAANEAARANEQARIAKDETGRANAVKAFLLDLFESSAPGDAQHAETADAILAKGLEQAHTKFAVQPDLQVEVLRTVGDIQHRRGQYDAARVPLEQALALARKQFGTGDERTLDVVVALSRLDETKGEYAHAEIILKTAISAYRAQAGGESVPLANALQQLGMMQLRQRQIEPAVQLEQQALDMFKRLLPADSVEINQAMIGLGDALDHADKPEQALALYREVVARTRGQYGDTHVLTAEALDYLATPLRELGHVDEAEAAVREAVAINSKVYLSPNLHATEALDELGLILATEGKVAASESVYQQSLVIDQQLFPGDHPDIASKLNNIARTRALLGHYAEADQLQREALAMDLRLYGEDHPYIAQDRTSLARWLIRERKLDEAAQLLAVASASNHKRFGDSHAQIASDLLVAAELAAARSDSANASTQVLAAIAMFERELPPHSPKLLAARLDAGRVLLTVHDFAQAEPTYVAAVNDARAGTPVVALYLARALAGLGDAQAGQHRDDSAQASWQEAKATLEHSPETDETLAGTLIAKLKLPSD